MSKIMPISPKLRVVVVALLAAVLGFVIMQSFAATGPATLYTSPAGSQSVAQNSIFTVNVRISTAANVPVTAASVYMSYPSDKLHVETVTYAGSPYNIAAVQTDPGGTLRMDRAALPKISGGDNLFAQVQFKAISSGAAPIALTGSSYVTSGDDDSDLPLTRQGVTYMVTSTPSPPPSPAPSVPTPSPSPPSSSATHPAATPPATTKPNPVSPAIPSSSSTGSPTTAVTPQPPSSPTSLPVAKLAASHQVELTVVDGKQKTLADTVVTIGGIKQKTNNQGKVVFTDIKAGEHIVTVRYRGKDTSSIITVSPASPATPQAFTLVAGAKFGWSWSLIAWVVGIVLLVMIGSAIARAGISYLRSRRLSQPLSTNTTSPGGTGSGDVTTTPASTPIVAPGTVVFGDKTVTAPPDDNSDNLQKP